MVQLKDCIDYILENEGGYSDDLEDSGGPTNWGITQEDLARFMGHTVSPNDVRNMTRDTALMIYQRFYWGPLHMAELNNEKIATAVFDVGVNRGIVRGIKYAQRSCNQCGIGPELVVDGHVGPKTIASLKLQHPTSFIESLYIIVAQGYRDIVSNNPSQSVFINGWLRRARRLKTLI